LHNVEVRTIGLPLMRQKATSPSKSAIFARSIAAPQPPPRFLPRVGSTLVATLFGYGSRD